MKFKKGDKVKVVNGFEVFTLRFRKALKKNANIAIVVDATRQEHLELTVPNCSHSNMTEGKYLKKVAKSKKKKEAEK